jgi:hypothetical protein
MSVPISPDKSDCNSIVSSVMRTKNSFQAKNAKTGSSCFGQNYPGTGAISPILSPRITTTAHGKRKIGSVKLNDELLYDQLIDQPIQISLEKEH